MRDDLRTSSLPVRVKNLSREATNLKTAQFTGWDSIKCYTIQTTNTWDYQTTLTPSGFNFINIQVRYTADYQDAPFGTLIADIQLDGNYEYRKANGVLSYPNVSINEIPTRKTFFSTGAGTPRQLFWNIQISTSATVSVKVKLKVFATQPGRLMAGAMVNDSFSGTVFLQ